MATLNWPGFGLASISPTLDQPSQSNSSGWTGKRTVVANPWHGKWSFQVTLATRQGDAAFQAARAFFTSLKGQINTFHLPAVEAAQNGNTGVTLSANAAQGATSLALTGVTTALVAGNMVTIAGQLLSLTTVGSLSAGAQTVNFQPALRAAASSGASVETAKPYALVYLSDSSFTWDIGSWRRYGLTFSAAEAVSETDGADPALDVWTGGVGSSGGTGTSFSFPQLTSFISRTLLAAVVGPTDKQLAYLTEPGREGDFVFSTANLSALVTADSSQGVYVAPSSDTSGASGAWVRKFGGGLNVKWFGAVANGTTDDSAAFVAALAYLKATGNAWQSHGYGGPGAAKLFIPKGISNLGSTTLDITCGLIIEGEGGSLNGPGSSVLTWTSNVTGIRIQSSNTSGATTSGLSNTFSGDGVLLRNFSMDGAYGSGAESEAHGIHLRGHAQLENIFIDRFAGDGIHISADASGSNGNANNWSVVNCQVQRCRNGLFIDGPDSNAGYSIGFSGNGNRRWSIFDSSFLGNLHVAPHSASSGRVGFGDGTTTPVTLVHKSGRLFTPVHGQEATASTTSPPASATDTVYWLYYSTGSITASTPDWVSGINIRSGGSYVGDEVAATGLFLYAYSESDGPPAQVFGSWEIKGGQQGAGNPGGNGHYEFTGSNERNVGYTRGAPLDYSLNINSTNFGNLTFNDYSTGTRVQTGFLRGFTGGYMSLGFVTEMDYVRNGVTIAYWNGSGLNLQTGYTLSVNSLQVVGARKTGWAVDTGTAKRTANATYAAGTTLTYSATYVQAEQTAMATRMAAVEAALRDATQTIKALKDDLHGTAGHGLIGT